MENFLYNIIIYPLVQLLDLCYLFIFRVFDNHGISIIGVSFAVSLFTLPLYFEAEKWQQLERTIREKLTGKTAKIKAVFHGDERYMVLSSFYRQNHYHPIYSLRSSIGLFLQIPFFIAAYSYLSKLDAIMGTPFLGIANLGAPDGLIKIESTQGAILVINILPILMTIVNIAASIIYLKNINVSSPVSGREKIQFFGTAIIFLVLLYNSPSGLVLYWTFNNIFSLIKNILQKTKYARHIIFCTACLCGVLLAVFVLFFHHGVFYKRIIVASAGLSVFCFPFFIRQFKYAVGKLYTYLENNDNAILQTRTIVLSAFILFLLAGIAIPSSLVASSVEEFSFIEQYVSPLPFILHTAEQAFGFFVFWILCVYFLLRESGKYFLTAFVTVISICALINTFAFVGNYGTITIEMEFFRRELLIPSFISLLVNISVLLAACGLTFFLLCCRRKQILQFWQIVIFIALFITGVYRIAGIYVEFRSVKEQRKLDQDSFADLSRSDLMDIYTPVYEFSKTGKNVLIIMLDRAIPGFVPQIFREKPELDHQFSGFTFFPNTISFGSHTIYGAPALFGGYEYAPAAINTRLDETFASKYNESFLVLPKIFLENDYQVTITDPPLYEETMQNLFTSFPGIKAAKIMEKYAEDWLNRHPDVQLASISNLLNNRFIYFSFLKCAPLVFRHYIYDHGRWLAAENGNTPLKTIKSYSMLDILPEITSFSDMGYNTFISMVNELPHEPAFLQAPDYTIPSVSSTNKGNGPFALDDYFHINTAALLLLGKWFMFLKENGVYDNTRIIVVSDHGINAFSGFEGNIKLPTGECLQFYTALLLFKDFNAQGELTIDNQFMVNADTPILALQGIISNPVNPFTQKALEAKKDGGVTITSSQNFSKAQHKNRYNIAPTEWLHVQDSIFDSKNWKKIKIE
jgi:YidC/Oxa1 family membrane protein insertase